MNAPRHDEGGRQRRPPAGGSAAGRVARWATFGIAAAVLAVVLGTIAYEYATGPRQPATIDVRPRLEGLRREGDRFYLPVVVRNRGGQAAENVRVRLRLEASGQAEVSELVITTLAGGARREATVVFRRNPLGGNLVVDAVSYLAP